MEKFSVFTNFLASFLASFVLFGAGANHLNNLNTSIPALLCLIAGIGGAVKLAKNRKNEA